MSSEPSKTDLKAALSAAASAHHDYETVYLKGVHDAQWPGFYAAYVLGRLGDLAPPGALATWLETAEGDDWVDAASDHVLKQLPG